MRLPNLNALRMFDAAARHLTFRAAAEEMNLTQGAVAQQVRGLEADLGLKLFERQARGLALSSAGRRYHPPVAEALRQIEEATRAMVPDVGQVRISVPPSFAAKWLVPRLRAFETALPDVDLQIVAEEAVARLEPGGVQLAVRQGRAPDSDKVDHCLLALLDLAAVAGPDAVLGADLGQHVLIQDSHRHWDALIAAGLVHPKHRMLQMNQTALAMDAARAGQGVALVPAIYVDAATHVLTRFAGRRDMGFHLVWARGRKRTRAEIAVADWITAQLAAQMPDGATSA